MPQVFLYAGTTSFPDPGDWDPVNNKVECVGNGGNGGTDPSWGGGGGAGGNYASDVNLTPTFPVSVAVGNPSVYGATFFSSDVLGPGVVFAYGGANGAGAYGGGPGPIAYPTGNIGGGGGTAAGPFGSGGGGSAGPFAGGAGVGVGGSAGGASDVGGPGSAPAQGPSGQPGFPGTQWDALHGCGGGGSGAGLPTQTGGAGGRYGGGAGGPWQNNAPVNAGANGLLVITWTSYTPPPLVVSSQAQIIA